MFLLLSFLQNDTTDTKVVLCCYQALNWYYYKFTVQGINIFALSILLWRLIGATTDYIKLQKDVWSLSFGAQ